MPEIRITGIRTRCVNVPLEFPIRTAVGTATHSPLVLIDLVTNTGVTGSAYLFTYTSLAQRPVEAMVRELAALVTGKELAPRTLDAHLRSNFHLLGHTGLVRMACAGIDMAAWDAQAKAHGVPLVRYLGGSPRPIPAYDSHGMDDVSLATTRAEQAAAQGFFALKTKIGYPSLENDLRVLRSIRKAVGPGVQIMVDSNQGLTVPEAIRRGRALDDEGIAWIEEPRLQRDYRGHREIRRAIKTPVQMGENWFGLEDMSDALASDASSLCMPDVMKIGGVSAWLCASALAEQRGMPMSSHMFQEFSAHLLAVTPTAHWLERMDVAAAVIEPTLCFKDGYAHVGDLPGAGLIWREDAIERFAFR